MPAKRATVSGLIKLKTAHEFAFSPDESLVAFIGGRDTSVIRLPNAETVFSKCILAHPSHIDFSPDGLRLAVKSTSGRVVIVDPKTGTQLCDFQNQREGEGGAALFTECGMHVVSVSRQGLFSVRHAETGALIYSDLKPDRMLSNLSASTTRKTFAYAINFRSPDETKALPPDAVAVRTWSSGNSTERLVRKRWTSIYGVQISSSGRYLAIVYGTPPDTLELYDIDAEATLTSCSIQIGCGGCSIAWSPTDSQLAINGDQGGVILKTPDLSPCFSVTLPYCCYVSFSRSGQFLGVGSWKKSLVITTDLITSNIRIE